MNKFRSFLRKIKADRWLSTAVASLLLILILVSFISFAAFIVMVLWNILADFFHFTKITFWIAFVIVICITFIKDILRNDSQTDTKKRRSWDI